MAGSPGMGMPQQGQQRGGPQIPPQILQLAQIGQQAIRAQQEQQAQSLRPPQAGFTGNLGATTGWSSMVPQQGLGQTQAIYGNLNRLGRF